MKKIALLFSILMCSIYSVGQNRNSIWCFGDSAGIDFNNINNPVPIISGMDSRGSCASTADANGNLLFYSATMPYFGPNSFYSTKVFNSTHSIMAGADSITGEAWYSELALFPKPGSDSLYYLFSNAVGPNPNQGMYFTIIDMSQNGGLGAIVQQNIQVDANVYGDCLTAVKHGNGRDWWVIGKWSTFSTLQTNRFFVYLVTPDSVYGPTIQDLGNAIDVDFQKIIWHPFLNKFMMINGAGFMCEYDFDRCIGTITESKIVFSEQTSNYDRIFWEGAYSPNGNVFYVSRTSYGGNFGDYNYLLQYDLTATNIPLSCDTLDSTMYPPVDCGALRLAPDGKIYYSQAYISQTVLSYPYADSMRNYINENLGVINDADVVGNGCNFTPFSFYLGGKRTYYGLPNNPNYSLGPVVGSPCDTLTNIFNLSAKEKVTMFYLSPNPATRIIYFNAQNVKGKNAAITIRNSFGEKVLEKATPIYNRGYVTGEINVERFVTGVYLIALQTEKEIISVKFVKK
ncbi:MAG: T9SS type A sorting domain-containing protein [Bacteroidia bacterium]